MPTGKLAAQAGHAYLEAFLKADESVSHQYRSDGIGTKVALQAKTLHDLLWAQQQCSQRGISCVLITDSEHVMPPHFDGSPVVTALGIGPTTREDVSFITNKFKLV